MANGGHLGIHEETAPLLVPGSSIFVQPCGAKRCAAIWLGPSGERVSLGLPRWSVMFQIRGCRLSCIVGTRSPAKCYVKCDRSTSRVPETEGPLRDQMCKRFWTLLPGRMRAHAKHENFLVVVALGSCCYVSYFLYSDLFGAYSDDQFWLYLSSSPKLVEALIVDAFLHGRPIGFFTYSAFFPILSLGGLSLVYLTVCAVLVLEASWFLHFLGSFSRQSEPRHGAVVPSVSAGHGQVSADHGLYSRFSAIAFWAGALCYLKRRPVLAAILSSSTMLIYETHLAQAALIPLLVFGMSRCETQNRNGIPEHP